MEELLRGGQPGRVGRAGAKVWGEGVPQLHLKRGEAEDDGGEPSERAVPAPGIARQISACGHGPR